MGSMNHHHLEVEEVVAGAVVAVLLPNQRRRSGQLVATEVGLTVPIG
jgi:hypothetical protein